MKHIAVLLTVFNRKTQTRLCLENLFKQKIPDGYILKVYLTDDGCTDGTPEEVRELFPQVHIIKGDGNLFWNRGMWTAWNVASKEHDYDYYLWLNDDTFLYNGAIAKLLASSEKNDDKSIIIGATTDTATHQKLTYGGRIGSTVAPCNGQDNEVGHFNGNIVLVPKFVYKVLGNLDYFFTHSKGDFDYGLRAKKAGVKMVQCGTPLGECDVHPTIDKWCDPSVPFSKRWKLMHRPNGMPPNESFHLNKRHNGLRSAIQVYITIHLRCLFPGLWIKLGKVKI